MIPTSLILEPVLPISQPGELNPHGLRTQQGYRMKWSCQTWKISGTNRLLPILQASFLRQKEAYEAERVTKEWTARGRPVRERNQKK